jgi:hypothetical protein
MSVPRSTAAAGMRGPPLGCPSTRELPGRRGAPCAGGSVHLTGCWAWPRAGPRPAVLRPSSESLIRAAPARLRPGSQRRHGGPAFHFLRVPCCAVWLCPHEPAPVPAWASAVPRAARLRLVVFHVLVRMVGPPGSAKASTAASARQGGETSSEAWAHTGRPRHEAACSAWSCQ